MLEEAVRPEHDVWGGLFLFPPATNQGNLLTYLFVTAENQK